MSSTPTLKIHPIIAPLEEQIIALRRHFHQHPELSYRETETARYILQQIDGLDLQVRYPVAETGLVATLANGDGPVIALRADMDALPIQETGDLPFRSVNEGVMHACGHDGHMAILLGVLLALDRHRDLWQGTVKFIFQPAEEGQAGADRMIKEGVLKNPAVEAIFGLHLWNYQDFGTVGIQTGPVMAAADEFAITVRGQGGHGAMPHGTVDAVVVASQLILNLQSIVSRNVNPLDAAVVTVAQINGGCNFNIIAAQVTLRGTARAYREETRQLIKDRLKTICDGTAATHGAAIALDYRDSYPPTVNDPAMTAIADRAARKVAGDGVGTPFLTMGGEDMAYYLRVVPGCFIFIGSAKTENRLERVPHHCSHFDIDERALAIGASVFTEIVLDMLPPGGK